MRLKKQKQTIKKKKTSGAYLHSTDVSYGLSVGSFCRLIQKVFNDRILVVESEMEYETDTRTPLCFFRSLAR